MDALSTADTHYNRQEKSPGKKTTLIFTEAVHPVSNT